MLGTNMLSVCPSGKVIGPAVGFNLSRCLTIG